MYVCMLIQNQLYVAAGLQEGQDCLFKSSEAEQYSTDVDVPVAAAVWQEKRRLTCEMFISLTAIEGVGAFGECILMN